MSKQSIVPHILRLIITQYPFAWTVGSQLIFEINCVEYTEYFKPNLVSLALITAEISAFKQTGWKNIRKYRITQEVCHAFCLPAFP